MASLPNSNFISFIKAYGPWADNEMQFEEHVRSAAELKNIKPFEYVIPFNSSIEPIRAALATKRSQIILICGRAGDGKTHLLGQLFEYADLLDLGRPNFMKLTATSGSFMEFDDVKGFKLSAVADLSQVPADSEEEQSLYLNILQVLEANERENAAKNAANADRDSAELSKPQLVLIAGNNGMILDKLTLLLKALTEQIESKAEGQSQKDETQDQDTKIEDQAKEFISSSWTVESLVKIKDKLVVIRNGLKRAFIEQQPFSSSYVTLVNLSNRVNAEVMHEIFDTLLNHEAWHNCQDCDCFNVCPIYRNREILSYPWLQQRLINVLHLLKVDGFPVTIRSVQSLLVNGLLGCGFEEVSKKNDMTCRKILNNFKANQGECNIYSNVYDNLLGLNIKAEPRLERDIFKAMHYLCLGQFTSKPIDNFLLSNIVFSSTSVSPDSLSGQYAQLKEIFIKNFDLYGINQDVANVWEYINKREKNFVEGTGNGLLSFDYQDAFSAKLMNLRRLLFFTIGAPLYKLKDCSLSELQAKEQPSSEEIQKSIQNNMFLDPFLMTKYPHAQAYFELEALVDNHEYSSVIGETKVAKSLILGLNRLFTGLYTSKDTSYLYIPASNINNMSLLYDDKIFKIKAYFDGSESTINLVRLPDYSVPVLQFKKQQSSDSSKVHDAVLVLTPYIFECLMQIAEGVSGLCLPEHAIYELKLFKDKILSLLEPYISSNIKDKSVNTLLSSVNRLDIEEKEGSIISREKL